MLDLVSANQCKLASASNSGSALCGVIKLASNDNERFRVLSFNIKSRSFQSPRSPQPVAVQKVANFKLQALIASDYIYTYCFKFSIKTPEVQDLLLLPR